MQKLKINQQKATDQMWLDETGNKIPYARLKPYERVAEKAVAKIATEALKHHTALVDFKTRLTTDIQKLYDLFLAENDGKLGKNKGSSTFYNFDRSIKVAVRVSDTITFDENTIELAKQKLDELLEDGLAGASEFIKPLVMDAFKTTGGRLDTKRVLGLRRYADRITDKRYSDAMALIDKAIRKPASSQYFQVWIKDDSGEYQDVQLNFSSIKI